MTESTSNNKLLNAADVAFDCFASQHPKLFNFFNTPAAAMPGAKKAAEIISEVFQNVTLSSQFAWKACMERRSLDFLLLMTIEVFGVSNVSLPMLHGPLHARDGIPDQARSLQIRKYPSGSLLENLLESTTLGAV